MRFYVLKYLCVFAVICPGLWAQDADDIRAMIESGELRKCGTFDLNDIPEAWIGDGSGSGADCSFGITNPTAFYEPAVVWDIPVVVHVIMNTAGQGDLTDQMIQSQIDILNEDFQALPGTLGEEGYDSKFNFFLATEDPDGNPTNGITRTQNNNWYGDNGNYWDTLAWDTTRYMNIYTNQAGGNLGYAFLAQSQLANPNEDRVVILTEAFGRNSPFAPYDLGRTTTHEVGHYFGLLHTFQSGSCVSAQPGCYTSGDLICDTNANSGSNFGCPVGATNCGGIDSPIRNYMNYTDDICMKWFTPEQVRRMRCSVQFYRPDLYTVAASCDVTDLQADAGADLWLCQGDSVMLDGSASLGAGGYSYLWAPSTTLSNPAVANPMASPTVTTTYVLEVSDATDCTSSDEVTVYVIPTNYNTYMSYWMDDYTDYDYDANGTVNTLDLVSLVNLCTD